MSEQTPDKQAEAEPQQPDSVHQVVTVNQTRPRHRFWGAGEPDCPPELKAPNGELHTARCKVCGDGWRKSVDVCFGGAAPASPAASGWLWTHTGKGGEYTHLGVAQLQTDVPLTDMAEVVVYHGSDGRLWARASVEFAARFRRVRPVPRLAAAAVAAPEQEPARLKQLRELVDVQGQHGNWNVDSYMCGLFNGMEFGLATMEGREPAFRSKPEGGWLDWGAAPSGDRKGEQMQIQGGQGVHQVVPSAEARPGEGWQPIETAPQDERIIAWVDWWDGAQAEMGELHGDEFKPTYRGFPSKTPTHWMPLPAAPDGSQP